MKYAHNTFLENSEEKLLRYSPHLWECCAAALAPGCVHHCRERGARCRGPCTQWSLFLGGRSAAVLWVLWRSRRAQSRTWAAPSRPTVSQSRTGHKQTTTRSSKWDERDRNSQKPEVKFCMPDLVRWCVTVDGWALWNCRLNAIGKLPTYEKLGNRTIREYQMWIVKQESEGKKNRVNRHPWQLLRQTSLFNNLTCC